MCIRLVVTLSIDGFPAVDKIALVIGCIFISLGKEAVDFFSDRR